VSQRANYILWICNSSSRISDIKDSSSSSNGSCNNKHKILVGKLAILELLVLFSIRSAIALITLVKLKVAKRGLYSTAAVCIADCALAPNGVPSFVSRGATTPSGAGALY
jgi:hypothetical protein